MKSYLVALALFVLTACAVLLTPPIDLAAGHGVLRAVPQVFGPWQGTDSAFERAVVDELRADDLLIRRYRDGERSVWLCLVYHQNRRYGSHDPLLCYTSQGYSVDRPGRERVDDGSPEGLTVNSCVAERSNEQRVVWYWWTTQGLSTPEVDQLRSRMALIGALENRSWGTFVRVESVVHDGDVGAATARVREFSALVARELPAVFAQAAPPGPK